MGSRRFLETKGNEVWCLEVLDYLNRTVTAESDSSTAMSATPSVDDSIERQSITAFSMWAGQASRLKLKIADQLETHRRFVSDWMFVLSELSSHARSPLHLRFETAEDAPALARIEKEAYAEAWTEEYFRGLLSKPNVRSLLAVFEEPIAFLIWEYQPDGWTEIINIATTRTGERIGPLLLLAMVEIINFMPADQLHLKVRYSNQIAIRFYLSLGFVRDVRRDFTWPNGEAGYVMTAEVQGVATALRIKIETKTCAFAAR